MLLYQINLNMVCGGGVPFYFQNYILQTCPTSKMDTVAKNRNFFKWLRLLFHYDIYNALEDSCGRQ